MAGSILGVFGRGMVLSEEAQLSERLAERFAALTDSFFMGAYGLAPELAAARLLGDGSGEWVARVGYSAAQGLLLALERGCPAADPLPAPRATPEVTDE